MKYANPILDLEDTVRRGITDPLADPRFVMNKINSDFFGSPVANALRSKELMSYQGGQGNFGIQNTGTDNQGGSILSINAHALGNSLIPSPAMHEKAVKEEIVAKHPPSIQTYEDNALPRLSAVRQLHANIRGAGLAGAGLPQGLGSGLPLGLSGGAAPMQLPQLSLLASLQQQAGIQSLGEKGLANQAPSLAELSALLSRQQSVQQSLGEKVGGGLNQVNPLQSFAGSKLLGMSANQKLLGMTLNQNLLGKKMESVGNSQTGLRRNPLQEQLRRNPLQEQKSISIHHPQESMNTPQHTSMNNPVQHHAVETVQQQPVTPIQHYHIPEFHDSINSLTGLPENLEDRSYGAISSVTMAETPPRPQSTVTVVDTGGGVPEHVGHTEETQPQTQSQAQSAVQSTSSASQDSSHTTPSDSPLASNAAIEDNFSALKSFLEADDILRDKLKEDGIDAGEQHAVEKSSSRLLQGQHRKKSKIPKRTVTRKKHKKSKIEAKS